MTDRAAHETLRDEARHGRVRPYRAAVDRSQTASPARRLGAAGRPASSHRIVPAAALASSSWHVFAPGGGSPAPSARGGEEEGTVPVSSNPMIEVRGLTKRYGEVTAVRDLSFDMLPGRVTGAS